MLDTLKSNYSRKCNHCEDKIYPSSLKNPPEWYLDCV